MLRRKFIKYGIITVSALTSSTFALISDSKTPPNTAKGSRLLSKLFEHGKYTIWKLQNKPGFFFKAGLAIDADGAANAYHPQDKGIDDLKHAGEPGNWWALVTDNGQANGKPVIQGKLDPYPGYYISATALYDETKKRSDPKRYVDSTKIPYVVLPQNNDEEFLKVAKIKLGDLAVIYNSKNGKVTYAIFADTSLFFAGGIEEYRFGEGSIALANSLNIPANPKKGGIADEIFYVFFPGSGNGKPKTITQINNQGAKLFKKWVFYDPNNSRWLWFKRISKAFIVIIFLIFFGLIATMVIQPDLPKINLSTLHKIFKAHNSLAVKQPNISSPYSTFPNFHPSKQQPNINVSKPVNSGTVHANSDIIGFYVNWDDNSFTSLKQNLQKLDKLMPEWLHLDKADGTIANDDEFKQQKTINYIHKNRPKLPIMPLINNFDNSTQSWNSQKIAEMLNQPTSRSHLIQQLLEYIRKNNFAGINIDFENIPDSSQANFITFMGEIYAQFHPLGLEVSQSVPLDNPSFNYREFAKYNDYLILMAYDEHDASSSSGPIASQNWYAEHLKRRFQELPASKFVVAIGSYGYDWKANTSSGEEISFQESLKTAQESNGKIILDPASLNATFDYYDDKDTLHHIWYLDAVTAFNQLIEAKNQGAAGFALWRMGSEDPSIWQVFKSQTHLDRTTAKNLETLRYGFDIDYEGKGEILKVTAKPSDGKREINYDHKSGLVVREKLISYPSAYVITRWGGSNKNKIALTFDDAPDQRFTPGVLDTLKRYHVPATFFVVGINANGNSDLLHRIVKEGHEIGNHTFTHPNIAITPHKQLKLELNATERLLEGELGLRTLLFRPPYAEDVEPETPEEVAPLEYTGNLGYYIIGMQIDPNDWRSPGIDKIVDAIVEQATSGQGNVVLLHDSGGDRTQTVAALPKIIEELQKRNFELVTISNLLGLQRNQVMPPITAQEQLMARFDGTAFLLMNDLNKAIYYLFVVGIGLSMMRLLFVAALALYEWKSRKSFKNQLNYSPSVSVIVPAFNEEKVICRTIDSLLRSHYGNFDIIVVDDGSSDNTYKDVAQKYGNESRVRVFTKANGGKAHTTKYGILQTQAEIIVSLDADTILRPNAIKNLVRHFADPKIGTIAGNAKVGNRINILTYWQALEYITSQNLERRAFGLLNCISVVPGAIGAWRRELILKAGGYATDTLAEDADLTLSILRMGYKIDYEENAIALTEAPDTIQGFLKQRFRWMFGTLQATWKHRDTIFRKKYGALGLFAIPNVLVFQILFPLISPLMDVVMIGSIAWAMWQKHEQPAEYSTNGLEHLIWFYLLFLAVDFLAALVGFLLEPKEDWNLMIWLLPQRFFYRQLMYYVAIKSTITAIKGSMVGWGKIERKATVN
ncbi:glycosyltransferase [Brunnivagina elsteri]|uniref:Polysaccharide deacetylase n=1 Tax=Brunnivagina elsteri CCALA 953 TaxID=987040 RepID=A0A2A2THR6_9CYAN|nr:glycosyltransferase [Calothrix elsteri]PAX53290.1 polysaccharide deacetylase [Calothrix elsteri CCALA 953]